MPNNFLSNDESIQGKWGAPPHLTAAPIAGVLQEILQQKRWQQAQTQKALAETIQNVREERQSAQYLDAMKAAGLVPQDYDAGGLGGVKLGSELAKQIMAQKVADARAGEINAHAAYYNAKAANPYAPRSGGRGGGGSDTAAPTVPPEVPEDYYGLSVAPGDPSLRTTRTINGIVQVQKAKGRWETAPKWMQPQGSGAGGGKAPDLSKAVKERLELQDQFDILEKKRKAQEAADITANRPANPFEKSDLYNLTKNRLKQLQDMPGMPSTEPAVTGDAETTTHPRIQSDKAGGHAEGYGVPPVGTERGGYRFKGGDPKDPNSWEPI